MRQPIRLAAVQRCTHGVERCCGVLLLPGLIRYLPLRQNKTGVNLLTTGGNLTTQKVSSSLRSRGAAAAAFAHA
jgi:hypothetical protein